MFDERDSNVLDEGTWRIVYSFFHPEEGSFGDGIGSLLSGLLSGPIGIASRASLPGTIAAPRFYSGRTAIRRLAWRKQ